MTTSEVKSGLDGLGQSIAALQAKRLALKQELDAVRAQLDAIPGGNAALVAEVGTFAPTGAFQSLAKDELAKLTAEFQALKGDIQTAHDAL